MHRIFRNSAFFAIFAIILYCVIRPQNKNYVQAIAPLRIQKIKESINTNIKMTDGGILSSEEALDFAKLETNNEKVQALLDFIGKIDKNADQFLDKQELMDWTNQTVQNYLKLNIQQSWSIYNSDFDDKLTWEEFKEVTYAELGEKLDVDEDLNPIRMEKVKNAKTGEVTIKISYPHKDGKIKGRSV